MRIDTMKKKRRQGGEKVREEGTVLLDQSENKEAWLLLSNERPEILV